MYDDLSAYINELKEKIEGFEQKQKGNTTQNICGYCHDEGVIDGMNRVLRDIEKLLADYEEPYDWDDTYPCGCCTCCGCMCDD